MKQIFVLTYNYTNKKLAQMAIACVIRCRSTHGKQLRVRDIIEMNRPGLYQQLSRGDKCRVGRSVSKLYNQGMLPHLTRGKKKGSTNTSHNEKAPDRLISQYIVKNLSTIKY